MPRKLRREDIDTTEFTPVKNKDKTRKIIRQDGWRTNSKNRKSFEFVFTKSNLLGCWWKSDEKRKTKGQVMGTTHSDGWGLNETNESSSYFEQTKSRNFKPGNPEKTMSRKPGHSKSKLHYQRRIKPVSSKKQNSRNKLPNIKKISGQKNLARTCAIEIYGEVYEKVLVDYEMAPNVNITYLWVITQKEDHTCHF